MSKLKNRPSLSSLPLTPFHGHSDQGVTEKCKLEKHVDTLEFIPLASSPPNSPPEECELKFPDGILRPKESNFVDKFFVIDTTATPIKLNLSYMSSSSPSPNSKKKSLSPKKSNTHTGIIGGKVTKTSGIKTRIPVINLEEDDDDVIFEGSKSADFISLNKPCQSKNLEKVPGKILSSNYLQKRNVCSQGNIGVVRCRTCRKIKNPNDHKASDANKNNTYDISSVDNSIVSFSKTSSVISDTPLPEKYEDLINLDDSVIFERKADLHIKDQNELLPNSPISNIEKPISGMSMTDSQTDLNKNSDIEDGELLTEESDKESVSMDIDEENGSHLINIDDTVIENDINEDFVPLKTIKVSDLQYKVNIPDYVLNKRIDFENRRNWQLTLLGEKLYKSPWNKKNCIFKVLSYNVLSQQLIYDNKFLYNNCKEEYLDWSYRWPLLQHEINHLQPDIMTLQEVEANHYYTHYLPWFTHLGYKCIFKKRTSDKVDGCAIIFKADKFTLIEQVSVEYKQPLGGASLDRDNIGLIIKLTPTEFHSPFCIVTTHLLYNPRRQDVRIAQLAVLFTELDRLCYKGSAGGLVHYCPIILTGDFNSDPFSKAYEFVNRGKVFCEGLSYGRDVLPTSLGISDYCQHTVLEQSRYLEKVRGNNDLFSLTDKRFLEEDMIKLFHSNRNRRPTYSQNSTVTSNSTQSTGVIQHCFIFNSVYKHKNSQEVTTKHNTWLTVDYIFYTKVKKPPSHIEAGKSMYWEGPLKLLGKYRLPTIREARIISALPSQICPSDHFPLAAQFLLTP